MYTSHFECKVKKSVQCSSEAVTVSHFLLCNCMKRLMGQLLASVSSVTKRSRNVHC